MNIHEHESTYIALTICQEYKMWPSLCQLDNVILLHQVIVSNQVKDAYQAYHTVTRAFVSGRGGGLNGQRKALKPEFLCQTVGLIQPTAKNNQSKKKKKKLMVFFFLCVFFCFCFVKCECAYYVFNNQLISNDENNHHYHHDTVFA